MKLAGVVEVAVADVVVVAFEAVGAGAVELPTGKGAAEVAGVGAGSGVEVVKVDGRATGVEEAEVLLEEELVEEAPPLATGVAPEPEQG